MIKINLKNNFWKKPFFCISIFFSFGFFLLNNSSYNPKWNFHGDSLLLIPPAFAECKEKNCTSEDKDILLWNSKDTTDEAVTVIDYDSPRGNSEENSTDTEYETVMGINDTYTSTNAILERLDKQADVARKKVRSLEIKQNQLADEQRKLTNLKSQNPSNSQAIQTLEARIQKLENQVNKNKITQAKKELEDANKALDKAAQEAAEKAKKSGNSEDAAIANKYDQTIALNQVSEKSGWTPTKLSSEQQTLLQNTGFWLSTISKYLMMPSLAVLGYTGKLMENKFIFDDGKMEEMLKRIWTLSRDIVNVIFVLVLLFVAFINVVKETWSASGWELKSILPKIVIALVAVNFSWSACKVMIDLSNIGTAVVLAIPQSYSNQDPTEILPCVNVDANKEPTMATSKDGICTPDIQSYLVGMNLAIWWPDDSSRDTILYRDDVTFDELVNAVQNMHTIKAKNYEYENNTVSYLLGLAGDDIITMAHSQENIKTLTDLTIDALVSVILAIAYFIVFICLFIVLMARLIIVWIVIAFSPILILEFVMGDKFKITDKIGDVKIFKEFFMPMLIAFPIVIGTVMLTAGKMLTQTGSAFDRWSTELFDGMFGGYNLMWKIAAIVILWTGVFSAMNDSIANGVVNTIKDGAKSTGKFALKAFRYAPIFPVKIDTDGDGELTEKDRNASFEDLANMAKMPQLMMDDAERKSRERIRDHAKTILEIDLDSGTGAMHDFENTNNKNIPMLKQALEKATQNDPELIPEERKKIVNKLKDWGHLRNDQAAENLLRIKKDEDFRKALKDNKYIKTPELRDGNYFYQNGNSTTSDTEKKKWEQKIENTFVEINNQVTNGNADQRKEGVKNSLTVLSDSTTDSAASRSKYREATARLEETTKESLGIKALTAGDAGYNIMDEIQKLAKIHTKLEWESEKQAEILDKYQAQINAIGEAIEKAKTDDPANKNKKVEELLELENVRAKIETAHTVIKWIVNNSENQKLLNAPKEEPPKKT